MPVFKYRAIDQFGKFSHGQMEVINEIDLESRLENSGLSLISTKQIKVDHHWFQPKKLSTKDLMIFCFELEQAASVGMPLVQTLIDLHDANPASHLHKIIADLIGDIESGKLFSAALSKHPEAFDQLFISLVVAGEKTGRLAEVFSHLSARFKWQSELAAQTKRLISYPIFVMAVMMATVAFLMIYLIPQMVIFLTNMGQTLPLQTRALIAISNFLVSYWWGIALFIMITMMGSLILIKKNIKVRHTVDQMIINLPVIGVVWKKMMIARFSRYLALMYQSGIPVLDAIKTCEEIVGNLVVKNAVGGVYAQINAGASIADSFQGSALFPSLVIRMVRAGEATGTLDQSLMKIAYFYDRDVAESIENALKLIEPALTIVLGLILAFIMISTLGPVYDSFSQLKL